MDLNHRPIDFQSIASTAELPGHVIEQRVTPKGDSKGTRVAWIRTETLVGLSSSRVRQLRSKLKEQS